MQKTSKIDSKILNHLKIAKTLNGKVGAKVSASGDNPNNQAWVSIIMNKANNAFRNYEVEYLELREDYDEFYVRKETYYNIKNQRELEILISRWISDLSHIKPISYIDHPNP